MASEGSPKASSEAVKEWEAAAGGGKEKERSGKGKGNPDVSISSGRSRPVVSADGKAQHRGSGAGSNVKPQAGGIKSIGAGQKQVVASGSHTDHLRDKWEKFDSGMRRQHDAPLGAKQGEELRMQQAKRLAWVRAHTAGATGNYKNCDSQFGNFLVPVIPSQFFSKPGTPSATGASPASIGFAAPSLTGSGAKPPPFT